MPGEAQSVGLPGGSKDSKVREGGQRKEGRTQFGGKGRMLRLENGQDSELQVCLRAMLGKGRVRCGV
jgi:hypothetical protein